LGKHENVTSAVIFCATGGDVSDVFVDGKRLVKDGVLLTIDVPALINRVRQTAEKITNNI